MGGLLRHSRSLCVLNEWSIFGCCFGALAAPVRQCEVLWTTWEIG